MFGPRLSLLDDLGAFLAPVGVADQALVELAGRVAGQLLHEVDDTGRLHVAEVGAAEGGRSAGGFAGVGPVHRLDHGDDLFTHFLMRPADHGRVGYLGVGDQQVLEFLQMFTPPEMIMKLLRSVR